MSTDLTDLPHPRPAPLYYVRYRDKGKWREEPLTNAHEAVENGLVDFDIPALIASHALLRDGLRQAKADYLALCQFLVEWDGQGSFRDYEYRDQLNERYVAWVDKAKVALAGLEE